MDSAASNRPETFRSDIGDEFGDGLAEVLRARVKAELEPGERLLWASRSEPPPAPIGHGTLLASGYAAIFLLMGGLTITYAMRESWLVHYRALQWTFGIASILVGCLIGYSIVSWRVLQSIERRRQAGTDYAVTDRRAIAMIPDRQGEGTRVLSLPGDWIRGIDRTERPDGSGCLQFIVGEEVSDDIWPDGKGFDHIPEVRRVEQIVRNNLMTAETRDIAMTTESPTTR